MTQTISLNAVPRPAGGYFFEDYVVGRRFHHVTPRTLTNGDAALYIGLTGARQPVHCCEPLARAMGHRTRPLDDFLVFNVAFGKTVPDISYNAIANPKFYHAVQTTIHFNLAHTFAAARAVLFCPNSITLYKLPSTLMISPERMSAVVAMFFAPIPAVQRGVFIIIK